MLPMSFAVAMSSFFLCQLSDSWYHFMESSVLKLHTWTKRSLGNDQHRTLLLSGLYFVLLLTLFGCLTKTSLQQILNIHVQNCYMVCAPIGRGFAKGVHCNLSVFQKYLLDLVFTLSLCRL